MIYETIDEMVKAIDDGAYDNANLKNLLIDNRYPILRYLKTKSVKTLSYCLQKTRKNTISSAVLLGDIIEEAIVAEHINQLMYLDSDAHNEQVMKAILKA